MITERTSPCLFLLCRHGLSTGELEEWRDELTRALQWPEPEECPTTEVSVVSSGVTSKAEHSFLLVQIQGPIPRSFTRWLGEAARQHDFVAIPSRDLFVLFLKRDAADEQAPQMMADSPSSLAAFLAEAQQRDETLAQTLVLVAEAIGHLEQDHLPRGETFWVAVAASLEVVKQALEACLASSDDSRVPWPVPDAVDAASTKADVLFDSMRSCLREVNLRLTAYRNRSSLAQKHLRQRQGVLEALRALRRTGQEALKQRRVWLDLVQQDHTLFRAPSSRLQAASSTAGKSTLANRRKVLTASQIPSRSTLRLVKRQEPEEDLPGPPSSG